jgi:protein-disulfide isomerase
MKFFVFFLFSILFFSFEAAATDASKASTSDAAKKSEVDSYEEYLKDIADFEKSDKFNPKLLEESLPLDMNLGDVNAPIKLVEYASLSCIHCKQFHQEVFYNLKKNYIDTGKVYFKYRHYPLNAPAVKAALIKGCLAEDQQLAFLGAMFESQAQWAYSKSEADLKDKLKTISKVAGLTDEKFEQCYNDTAAQDGIIANMKRAFDELRITATPTIFINGKRYMESRAYEGVAKYLDGVLAEKPVATPAAEKKEEAAEKPAENSAK